jgi:predicted phage terminase large subunit-like protein
LTPKAAQIDEDTVLAATSPAGFAYVATRGTPEPYIPEEFHCKISEGIVDIEQGRLELLVIDLPIQHGKSTTASQWGVAWMLGLHPTWHVIAGTYNTDFAEDKIGRPTRDILERHGEKYFGVGVDPRSHSMKRWNTTQGGQLIAGGVDKDVAGRPSDLFLIDDPYGGFKDAMSPKYRADVWQWFQINIMPRRKPVLRMIAIMSRWHEDDFIAQVIRLARSSGWKYRVLDFPAIAICPVEKCISPQLSIVQDESTGVNDLKIDLCQHDVRDELGRLPGDPLWPRVRNLDFLKRQALDIGGVRLFMAAYQGRPQQASGSTFQQHWFRYFRRDGDLLTLLNQSGEVLRKYPIQTCRVFQMVDLAAGDTQTLRSGITRTKSKRDFTVIGTFALCPNKELAVLDIFRDDKIDGPDQIRQIGQLRSKFRAGRIGIEAVAYQWTAVQAAVKSGLPVVPLIRGSESKETRAWTVAARYETGQVYHLRDAPWVEALETELLQFPNGAHDDQVDVLSDAAVAVAEAETRPMAIGVQV